MKWNAYSKNFIGQTKKKFRPLLGIHKLLQARKNQLKILIQEKLEARISGCNNEDYAHLIQHSTVAEETETLQGENEEQYHQCANKQLGRYFLQISHSITLPTHHPHHLPCPVMRNIKCSLKRMDSAYKNPTLLLFPHSSSDYQKMQSSIAKWIWCFYNRGWRCCRY